MNNSLERIQIVGLHGNKTWDVKMKENTLILVGENGSGKTTFLRILFYFLSGRWLSLVQFQFDEIIATINGTEYKLTREELIGKELELSKFYPDAWLESAHFSPPDWKHLTLNEQLITTHSDKLPSEWTYRSDSNKIKAKINKKFSKNISKLRKAISAQILYLPTYRRIERELNSIFEGMEPDGLSRQKGRYRSGETGEGFIELIEFGMKDVQDAIDRELASLKEFARENLNGLTLGYLGDVIDREYRNIRMNEIADVSDDTVRSVLNRIDESILDEEHKKHLFSVIDSARSNKSPDDHSKIISHYFLKLLKFQELLQDKERSISDFCALCSKYTVDKRLVYNSANFSFSIVPKDDKSPAEQIKLGDLSSGEKQIVSLFSHLYLSGQKSYFILIDEPELSLSVPWQRRFLIDIHNSGFCAGLVAATHSPFIYDNDLLQYAHSLGEFVRI